MNLSLSFYRYHKKLTLMAMFSIILGMVFMSVVLLLIRSNKMTEYEQGLSAAGNYNYIVVDAGKQDVEKIKKSGLFSGIGMIKREGTVAITGNEIKLVSADKNSIAMYHLSCLEGRYPKEQDEIAAPYDFFKKMGIVPKIGNHIQLSVTDSGQQKEDVTYKICGILEHVDRYWGEAEIDYDYPEVFVGIQNPASIDCIMLIENTDANKVYSFLDNSGFIYGDTYGASGVASSFLQNTEMSQQAVEGAKDTLLKDFESRILIPVFAVILSFFSILLTMYSFQSLYDRRKKTLEMYNLFGMKKSEQIIRLFLEFLFLSVIAILLGATLGGGIYQGIYLFQKQVLNVAVQSGWDVNDVIAAVTFRPILFSAVVLFFSSLFSIIAILGYKGGGDDERILWLPHWAKRKEKKYWQQLEVSLKISVLQRLLISIVIVVMYSCLYFSLLYLYAQYNVAVDEEKSQLYALGLQHYDEIANKDFTSALYEDCALNQHDKGVPKAQYKKLKKCPAVDQVTAFIQIPSMKILYENTQNPFSEFSLYSYTSDTLSGMEELVEKSQKTHGYTMKEYKNMYNIPMTAVEEKDIKQAVKGKLLAGAINEEKLKRGEEVVLLVPSEEVDVSDLLGQSMHFTDLKIEDEKIEKMNLSSGEIPDWITPDFSYQYKQAGTGETRTEDAYAFGKRYDFYSRIGAIVAVEDMESSFYYTDDLLSASVAYNIVTTVDALKKFDVPDHNYTKIGVKTKETATTKELKEYEKDWLSFCNAQNGMEITSSKEIKNKIWGEKKKSSVFFVLMAVIVTLFSYLLWYFYIKDKKYSCRTNREILSFTGCPDKDVSRVFFRLLGTGQIAAFFTGWIPLVFYELRLLQIYKKNGSDISFLNLLRGNTGIMQVTADNMQSVNGGISNLFIYPYIKIYLITYIISLVILLVIVWMASRKFTAKGADEV